MKILVTGGTGMLGKSFQSVKTSHDLVFIGSKDFDLRDPSDAWSAIGYHSPDAIIHLAARVGGVKGNTDFVGDFYLDNSMINTNLLWAAKTQKIETVLSLLSTCIYPDKATYPLTPHQMHSGEPHKSNFGYAYSKRMLEVSSRAIRLQYGFNYMTAVPNNLYGPHDNFDLENGHVIPAIIRKVWEAKHTSNPPTLWGSGKPLREFTFSQDIARALLHLVENYNDPRPINIGSTTEVSIAEVTRIICEILDYDFQLIAWDTSKPEGQFRKPSSNKEFINLCKDFEYTSLRAGLEATCGWFVENYPNVRGMK